MPLPTHDCQHCDLTVDGPAEIVGGKLYHVECLVLLRVNPFIVSAVLPIEAQVYAIDAADAETMVSKMKTHQYRTAPAEQHLTTAGELPKLAKPVRRPRTGGDPIAVGAATVT